MLLMHLSSAGVKIRTADLAATFSEGKQLAVFLGQHFFNYFNG